MESLMGFLIGIRVPRSDHIGRSPRSSGSVEQIRRLPVEPSVAGSGSAVSLPVHDPRLHAARTPTAVSRR